MAFTTVIYISKSLIEVKKIGLNLTSESSVFLPFLTTLKSEINRVAVFHINQSSNKLRCCKHLKQHKYLIFKDSTFDSGVICTPVIPLIFKRHISFYAPIKDIF